MTPSKSLSCALTVAIAFAFAFTAGSSFARADGCACSPADFDHDGDVDQADFGHLQSCLTGRGIVPSNPDCLNAKLDSDADIDQEDITFFRNCMSGTNQPFPGSDLPPLAITEFVASNDAGLADETGGHPDWIEIHNPCQPSLNLQGWYLTDDITNLTKWQFPSVVLNRGQFLVVFASGDDKRDPAAGPLHTNFQLESDKGEYLALVAPDGQTVIHQYAPTFPEQIRDVSYGTAQLSVTPVTARAQARYYVPTAGDAGIGTAWTTPEFDDSGWTPGQTGLGFSSLPPDFDVKVYRSNIVITDLATAETVISDPSRQSAVFSGRAPVVNFMETDAAGHYGGDAAFPGSSVGASNDNFVVLATATIVIPEAGEWSFGVNSDDGFGLRLTRGSQTFSTSYPDPRGAGDTINVFDITEPGTYQLRLIYFEQGGGAGVELFAAKGYLLTFDPSRFRLVGDTANGGLLIGSLGADIVTDLAPAMKGVNSSLWVRIPFNVEDVAKYSAMSLRMKYEDGFVAYLNGSPVVSRNAPDPVVWNSTSNTNRPLQNSAVYEEINLTGFTGLLKEGPNLIAFHGLNDSASEPDFLVLPELVLASSDMVPQYFAKPTPGTFNGVGSAGFVKEVQFSVPRGFKNATFPLELSTPTPGAQIRYTLNGSPPTEDTGLVYAGPITVDKTSVVRAVAFKDDHIPSAVSTNTYFFIRDILVQSSNGQAPGPGWPQPGWQHGQIIDYGMDPDIVTKDARYKDLVDDALLAIPSVSIVTDLKNLFDFGNGIYVNAGQDGRAWERPASVELIHPDGSSGFQIDCGLRIRGGYSRSGDNPKHAFRLLFRSEYGQGKLKYPLFGTEGTDEFDAVDLRTSQNYSWSFGGDDRNIMVRDVFSRDSQRDMGQPYTRSRFYHLYINGQYWGLYMTQERAEAAYAASYFGGSKANYDVVKVEAGPYAIYATDGDTNAFRRLWQTVEAGVNDTVYYRLMGLNPDGTPNPAYEALVDSDNIIDCMLSTMHVGDLDGPISAFLGNSRPNNFYGIWHHGGRTGFKYFRHDCEHTLLNPWEDRTGPFAAGGDFSGFNPQRAHQQLVGSPEYRMRFADRVRRHFYNGGALSREANTARLLARANEIDLAIIAESARWGDSKTHPPRNKLDHWLPTINWVVNSFFPPRNDVVIGQFRARGWYPSIDPPTFSQFGGNVPVGYELKITKPAGASGTIYYTLDGSDPRLPGGGISPAALVYNEGAGGGAVTLLARGSTWRYLDTGADPGTDWFAFDYPAAESWRQGPAQIGFNEGDEKTLIQTGRRAHSAYYFRTTFQAPAGTEVSNLKIRFVCDDGGAVYLNGTRQVLYNLTEPYNYQTRIPGANCVSGATENSYIEHTPAAPSAFRQGQLNVIAAEVHQCATSTSDLSFDVELVGTVNQTGTKIILNENTRVKARFRTTGGEWSALEDALFTTEPVRLYINEVMSDNFSVLEDPDEPGEFPDYIEIYNPGTVDVNLGGMYLTDDVVAAPTLFEIPNDVVAPKGGYVIFYCDEDRIQGSRHTNFRLSKTGGEKIGLVAADRVTILDQMDLIALDQDVAYGRYPDGDALWGVCQSPSPEQPNSPHQAP